MNQHKIGLSLEAVSYNPIVPERIHVYALRTLLFPLIKEEGDYICAAWYTCLSTQKHRTMRDDFEASGPSNFSKNNPTLLKTSAFPLFVSLAIEFRFG